MSLREISFIVAEAFFGEDVDAGDLKKLVDETLNFDIPLVKVSDRIYSLELFHGPTLAFKDVGAQIYGPVTGVFYEPGIPANRECAGSYFRRYGECCGKWFSGCARHQSLCFVSKR